MFDIPNVIDLMLDSILRTTRGNYEIIIVLDDCNDECTKIVLKILSQFVYKLYPPPPQPPQNTQSNFDFYNDNILFEKINHLFNHKYPSNNSDNNNMYNPLLNITYQTQLNHSFYANECQVISYFSKFSQNSAYYTPKEYYQSQTTLINQFNICNNNFINHCGNLKRIVVVRAV